MKSYKVLVLAGDGIGPEIVTEAIKVMRRLEQVFGDIRFEITYGLIGGAAWDTYQSHFPDETKKQCQDTEAVLFGSVGGPVQSNHEAKWKDCERNSILAIRSFLELGINLRPAQVFAPLVDFCPLKPEIIGKEDFDICVIRELLEDIYFGAHTRPDKDRAEDVAFYRRDTIKKFAKFCFETAEKREKKLTSIDKANVLETSRLWREVFTEVAQDFPQITLEHLYVDNAVQLLVKNPRKFDVIACPNLFGDIVSDLTSVLPGSLGMLPSASLGKSIHLYEPSGGSAPDIAGENIANPIAQILCVALMLRYSFNEEAKAQAIEKSVSQTIADGYRTGDITLAKNTALSTEQMGDMICEKIQS